jgi:2-dehydropantoate 2-reductase
MSMRTLSLGAGGTGGYFGGRLAAAGADVGFLLRPASAARLRGGSLAIRSVRGDLDLPVRVLTRDALDGPYDLVLLSCKAYDLDGAIDDIAPAVGLHTRILPLPSTRASAARACWAGCATSARGAARPARSCT